MHRHGIYCTLSILNINILFTPLFGSFTPLFAFVFAAPRKAHSLNVFFLPWAFSPDCPSVLSVMATQFIRRQTIKFWQLFCLVLQTVFCMSAVNYTELTYTLPGLPEYKYPDWAVGIGWGMAALSALWIPLYAVGNTIKFLCQGKVRNSRKLDLKRRPNSMVSPHFPGMEQAVCCFQDISVGRYGSSWGVCHSLWVTFHQDWL